MQRDRRPLSLWVADEIVRLIEEEGYEVGDAIHAEGELAEMFDVGRSTVREAITQLVNAGLLNRTRGSRSVVTPLAKTPHVGMETLAPFETLAERQGWRLGTEQLLTRSMAAPDYVADRLQRTEPFEVLYFKRLKTIESEPFALMESFVPADVAESRGITEDFEGSLTERLLASAISHAEAEVTAALADGDRAGNLDVELGSPLVVIDQVLYDDLGSPVSMSRNWFVPGKLPLKILRKSSLIPSGGAVAWK